MVLLCFDFAPKDIFLGINFMLGAIQIAQIMPAAASFEIEFPVLRWTSLLRGVPRRLEVAEGMFLFAYPLGWNGFLSCVHCKGNPRKPYEQVTELSSIIFYFQFDNLFHKETEQTN